MSAFLFKNGSWSLPESEPQTEIERIGYLDSKGFENRHITTRSEEDLKRQQRLLQYTKSHHTGKYRVKSAKESFKK